ncbi:dihydroxyacetone kinase subunit DhaL [Clostridium sp. DL1XJH146]
MKLKSKDVIEVINEIANTIIENKELLTDLDAAIGDADHGINMEKGFLAVKSKLSTVEYMKISDILKTVGMVLVSTVGGASGPLYGTAFMKGSLPVKEKEEIDINDFVEILEAALAGIKMRGKAQFGDKTMIDAIQPAIETMKNEIEKGTDEVIVLEKGKESAMQGVEKTKEIIARKGRASFLGERSIGHQDPGATSSYLILNTIYEAIKNRG